jgi:hypothetical protein
MPADDEFRARLRDVLPACLQTHPAGPRPGRAANSVAAPANRALWAVCGRISVAGAQPHQDRSVALPGEEREPAARNAAKLSCKANTVRDVVQVRPVGTHDVVAQDIDVWRITRDEVHEPQGRVACPSRHDASRTRVARPVQASDLSRVSSPQIRIRACPGHSYESGACCELLPAPPRTAVAAGTRRVGQEMPSLRVRVACPSVCPAPSHKGYADPRPEGHHGQAGRAPARALPPLAEGSHDGIVLDRHRNLEGLLEGTAHVHVGPRSANVVSWPPCDEASRVVASLAEVAIPRAAECGLPNSTP